jgi:hypothetical protein
MTRIYLEPGVLVARPDADDSAEASIVAEAADALSTLTDTGHELVLVSDRPFARPIDFPEMAEVQHVDEATDGSWFLTSDPELCGPRQARIKTILVGPGPGTHHSAVHRCDITTRDLRAAVLEILTREAMEPVA